MTFCCETDEDVESGLDPYILLCESPRKGTNRDHDCKGAIRAILAGPAST